MWSETLDKAAAWLQENGDEAYADYRDELPVEAIAELLQGNREAFDEELCRIQDHFYMYQEEESWSYLRDKLTAHLGIDEEDLSEEQRAELQEVFEENRWIDISDWIKSAARNTRIHVTATPYSPPLLKPGERPIFEEDQDERLFLFPHGYCSDEENERRRKKLIEVLGIMYPEEAETCYEFDELKMLGTLDVLDLIENGPPTHITIGPDIPNELITHNSVNGSGGLGNIKPTKTVTLPAMFEVDNDAHYGVDSVFGFVGEVWAKELPASRES